MRRFLPNLLQTVRFAATPAGEAVSGALDYLAAQEKRSKLAEPRLEIVTRGWRQYVFAENGTIDHKAYVFCSLERLRAALRSRDLFISPSIRYADARIGLLGGVAWEAARPTVCRSLGHSLSADETIAALSRQLDQTYRAVATESLPYPHAILLPCLSFSFSPALLHWILISSVGCANQVVNFTNFIGKGLMPWSSWLRTSSLISQGGSLVSDFLRE